MSIARNKKRLNNKAMNIQVGYLADMLGGFYEFLSGYSKTAINGEPLTYNPEKKAYEPTDEQVRNEFKTRDVRWRRFCTKNKLMKASDLFKINVAEAWKRHSKVQNEK